MRCPECGSELANTSGEYDYTIDAGLNPKEYKILLGSVDLYTCDCGTTAAIPHMEALHALIAFLLIDSKKSLGPSGFKYLRKYLQQTQPKFASLIGSTGPTVSKYENGHNHPERTVETGIRFRILSALMQLDRFKSHIPEKGLLGIIGAGNYMKMTRSRGPVEIPVPPAFLISELEKMKECGSNHHT